MLADSQTDRTTTRKAETMSETPGPISNTEDIIDSRDVIARLEYLREQNEAGAIDEDEVDELTELEGLAQEAEGYAADWQYGEALIRDTYFEDYARELAADIGAINPDAGWPNNCIDWERAARELRMDYTAVDFAGVTYWIR